LIKYGSFSGALANFAISGATGSLSNDSSGKTIYLVVASAIRNPTNVVWIGNGTVNDWDTVNRTNWINQGTLALDYFVSGDNARFDATGAANPNVNLVGNNAPASVTVDAAANYSFSGSGAISGAGGLTKTNSGTLTISTANTYIGPTVLGGGALEASTLAVAGSPCSIGSASADPNNLAFYGGTLRYLGASASTDRPATLNAPGGTLDVATNGTTLTLNGALGGAGALTKAGPGQLTLSVANTYSGGTVVSNGVLQVDNAAALGTTGLTNNHGTTLRINGALTLDNVMDFSGNCTLDLASAGGNTAVRGAWSGNGYVTIVSQQNSGRTFTIGGSGAGGGHMYNFSGTVDFGTNGGSFRINNDNSTSNFGSSNATFNVGTSTGGLNQRNGGTTTHLGALLGGPSTKLSGRGGTGASGITTYSIGGKNLDCTFDGVIQDGSEGTAITKVGPAKLTLTGASIHSGSTTVESGTLQVDGSFSSSAVAVNGGTLAGNGSLQAGVSVNSGGTLSPGASIGQMTVNSLSLQSGGTNIFEINKSLGTNDSITGLTSATFGGTLKVVNLAGSLVAGDTYQLFITNNAGGTFGGAFDTLDLPASSDGSTWDTSALVTDGVIKLALARPTIAVLNNGSSLTFSWTGSYVLMAQTNSTSVGLSTNWYDYPGGNVSGVTAPIDVTKGTVFFGLRQP
jgi:autotransporter-associated beta strand protein